MVDARYRSKVLTKVSRARTPMAGFFCLMCKVPRLRSVAIKTVCRLEGGQMWSLTYRDLMWKYYSAHIGRHSYGAPLWPGRIPEGTRVGNYCSLAAGIVVFRRNHPTDRFSQHPFFFNSSSGLVQDDTIEAVRDHPLNIHDDVWIGANVIITPRCRDIGLGSIIAAGAVVTKDVPPFSIVGGVPARRIGERFSPEIQEVLEDSHWWNHPMDDLIPVLGLFIEDASHQNAIKLREHLRRIQAECKTLARA